MFDTIKSKIITIVLLMLLMLSALLSVFTYIYYRNAKELIIIGRSFAVANFAQDINKEITRIEDGARQLSIAGEIYLNSVKNKKLAEDTVRDIVGVYKNSVGGGIWFKPYVIDPNRIRDCIYALRKDVNTVVIDRKLESDDYNYLSQKWYKEAIPKIKEQNQVIWTTPYLAQGGSKTLMVTAISGIYDKQGNMLGVSSVDWEIKSIVDSIKKIKPTPNSFVLFADKVNDYVIVSTDPYVDNVDLMGKSLKEFPWYSENIANRTYITYQGKKFVPYVKTLDNGMIIVVCVPKFEMFYYTVYHVICLFIVMILISFLIALVLYMSLNRNISKPINTLMEIANRISAGDTETEIKLEKPKEFAQLASTYDKMIKDIKNITRERDKIESELSIAKEIQASSLPSTFPPYPDRKEFDIYAYMKAAREVGGDFYDFYFTDENNLLFLIADVSGKGVPAALFMMTVKTLISNLAQVRYNPRLLIETINKSICTNNKQGFFVTMLAGIINLETGRLSLINCGHNPPLVKKNNGKYDYLELESNMVLGAFSGARFDIYETVLEKGDTIFTYTDGITEAVNADDEQYGEKRLKNALNNALDSDVYGIINNVKEDIAKYVEKTPQSDDMTMLVFKYNGKAPKVEHYNGIAKKENYKFFSFWLRATCQKYKLDKQLTQKIEVASEEIYTNVLSYAYEDGNGEIAIEFIKEEDDIELRFVDEGVQYNPLENKDPDIDQNPKDRPIGGLGIFIVKQSAKDVAYEYKDNKNILTLKF